MGGQLNSSLGNRHYRHIISRSPRNRARGYGYPRINRHIAQHKNSACFHCGDHAVYAVRCGSRSRCCGYQHGHYLIHLCGAAVRCRGKSRYRRRKHSGAYHCSQYSQRIGKITSEAVKDIAYNVRRVYLRKIARIGNGYAVFGKYPLCLIGDIIGYFRIINAQRIIQLIGINSRNGFLRTAAYAA